jgi:hypothetical protein
LVGYHHPIGIYSDRTQQQEEDVGISTYEEGLVSTQEGEDAARQIGAMAYIEWTYGTHDPYAVMEKLAWYGYYYHLSK